MKSKNVYSWDELDVTLKELERAIIALDKRLKTTEQRIEILMLDRNGAI